jgi:hypothetical protein
MSCLTRNPSFLGIWSSTLSLALYASLLSEWRMRYDAKCVRQYSSNSVSKSRNVRNTTLPKGGNVVRMFLALANAAASAKCADKPLGFFLVRGLAKGSSHKRTHYSLHPHQRSPLTVSYHPLRYSGGAGSVSILVRVVYLPTTLSVLCFEHGSVPFVAIVFLVHMGGVGCRLGR